MLESVYIGNGITELLSRTFASCHSLKHFSCSAGNVLTVNSYTFDDTNIRNTFLYVPLGLIDNYKSTSPWKDFKQIVAIGSKPTFKLTYIIDDVVYKTVEYEYGADITPEPAPDGDYSSFEWEGIPRTMPDYDVTVYAKYTIAQYTLTYMIENEIYKTVEYEYGAEIVPEPTPYSWFETFEWVDLPSYMPKEDITVYAKYTLAKYRLTYMIDDEVYKTVEYEYGAIIIPEPAPDGDYTSFEWEDIPATMPDHDVTVIANYSTPQYTLTYMIDGKVYKTVEYGYGDEIVPEPAPIGYASIEWEGLPKTMPKEDITVNAKYTLAKFKLIYMIDGEVYKTVEYEYGATIVEEPVPEGDYLSFKWLDVPSTMPNYDVVINAKYTKPAKPYRMVVSLKTGESVAFVLSEKPELKFDKDHMIVTTSTNTVDYLRSDVTDFRFEEVETGITSLEYEGNDYVKIYNMSGHKLATMKGGTLSEAKILLNSYMPGAYIIKVGNKVTIKYLVK